MSTSADSSVDRSLPLDVEPARHSRAQWEAATAAVLRKTRTMAEEDPDSLVWEKLARTTLDGIAVPPLGVAASTEDLPASVRPPRVGPWDLRAPVLGGNSADVVADLENGATSLWVTATADTDLATLLAGVMLDLAPVVLDAPTAPRGAAEALLALVAGHGVTPAPGTNLGVDPVGATVRGLSGTDADDLVAVARLALDAGMLGVLVDGTAVHDLGASDAQELGFTLAVGASYLRSLVAAGLSLGDALGLMEFRYAATDEQFPTIAKLRAARACWARVAELSGAGEDARGQRQHAVTSRPMMSAYDPYANMLRTTVAAFAAGVGGAEAVTVLPFDLPLGEPDAFGRRIARNVSSLLIAESHVATVSDPAGGAYAVEQMTHDLAEAAWAEFGRIEESGGIEIALADGSLRARIDDVVARRDALVATRRHPITGLSEFPNLAEVRPERRGEPDPVRRYGAAFEALRADPPTGRVFLATMGPVAAHTARATFATNLFAAGGIGIDAAGATAGSQEVVAAYAGQPVVCLAGTDGAYAEWGAELIAAVRAAGARRVILAGKPGARTVEADLLDDSCAMGLDALAFLDRTREALGQAREDAS